MDRTPTDLRKEDSGPAPAHPGGRIKSLCVRGSLCFKAPTSKSRGNGAAAVDLERRQLRKSSERRDAAHVDATEREMMQLSARRNHMLQQATGGEGDEMQIEVGEGCACLQGGQAGAQRHVA